MIKISPSKFAIIENNIVQKFTSNYRPLKKYSHHKLWLQYFEELIIDIRISIVRKPDGIR